MKLKVYVIDLDISPRVKKWGLRIGIPAVVLSFAAMAFAAPLHVWNNGDALHATDLNGNFSSVESLLKPTPFFAWTMVVASTSATETFAPEGQQTITFSQAGFYRITLDTQVIHDGGTASVVEWYIGGSATRLDPYSMEGGGQNVQLTQNAAGQDSRQVESTVLFVSATAGQTLTLKPSLTVTYSSGSFHQAHFMYAVEYLGQ